MKVRELPETRLVATASQQAEIARALREVLGGKYKHYHHTMPVLDGESSIRILSPEVYKETMRFPRPLSPAEMAATLLTLGKTSARYPRLQPPNTVKGWEIRLATPGEIPIAVVTAVWVPEPE